VVLVVQVLLVVANVRRTLRLPLLIVQIRREYTMFNDLSRILTVSRLGIESLAFVMVTTCREEVHIIWGEY
jgi:hypothetical protein